MPLQQSIISFSDSRSTYQKLSPINVYNSDVLITKLANIATSLPSTFPKLTALCLLQKTMEYFPKQFSWREYYALSELTAINLIDQNKVDKAISLIERIAPFAFYYYGPEISFSPLFVRSTSELLTLAYIVKGNNIEAERVIQKLIDYLHTTPNSISKDYLSRSYSILSLIRFHSQDFSGAIEFQNKAITLLQNTTGQGPLKAAEQYNLWVMHRSLTHPDEECITKENLFETLDRISDSDAEKIKAFIQENIQENKTALLP